MPKSYTAYVTDLVDCAGCSLIKIYMGALSRVAIRRCWAASCRIRYWRVASSRRSQRMRWARRRTVCSGNSPSTCRGSGQIPRWSAGREWGATAWNHRPARPRLPRPGYIPGGEYARARRTRILAQGLLA
jgi:hypothetical protein